MLKSLANFAFRPRLRRHKDSARAKTSFNYVLPVLGVLLLLLQSCLVTNPAITETARPIGKGNLAIGAEVGGGVDLYTAAFFEEDERGDFLSEELDRSEILGGRLRFGLSERFDASLRAWFGRGSGGFQAGGKYVFGDPDDDFGIALAPSFNYFYSDMDVWAFGIQLPLIVSHTDESNTGIYAALRYNFDILDIPDRIYNNNVAGEYGVHRIAATIGVSLGLGIVFLRPEIGYELVGRINTNAGGVPVYALGFGFEF